MNVFILGALFYMNKLFQKPHNTCLLYTSHLVNEVEGTETGCFGTEDRAAEFHTFTCERTGVFARQFLIPVSYTHLDVYKRQIISGFFRSVASSVRVRSFRVRLRWFVPVRSAISKRYTPVSANPPSHWTCRKWMSPVI